MKFQGWTSRDFEGVFLNESMDLGFGSLLVGKLIVKQTPRYSSILTPFQKATWSLMASAGFFGSG